MTDLLDSSTALDALQQLPLAIVIVHDENIIWVNQQFVNMSGLTHEQLINASPGQFDDKNLTRLFSGAGDVQSYETRTNQIHVLPETISLSGNQQMYVFHDVSQLQKLEDQVRQFTPKDSNTGLYNRRIILENLDSQVTRSRRYGNPLALLRLSISGNEADTAIRMKSVAEQLKDRLRWADCLGTLDESTILIILPETCLEEAKELAAKLVNDRAIASDGCTIQFGITAWQKGDDPARMLKNIEENQDVSTMALFS
ncbi:MAG: diguanylate cyclase [Gammaproteobacteria bacterium]|nr:diguanylate cyclase [Gammaproteobacteria bacterium]